MRTIYSINARKIMLAFFAFTMLFFASKEAQAQYCTASGGCDEHISKVEFGDISNSSSCGTSGYSSYTNISTVIYTGKSYDITITNGNPYPEDQVSVWIDWNKDEVFDNTTSSNEVFKLTSTDKGGTFKGTIIVPTTAKIATTRMRIRMIYTGTINPCGSSSWGETEDYSVNVQEQEMSYTSSTNTQITTALRAGSTGNVVIGTQVVTDGTANPYSLTQWNGNTTGPTNAATDISAAKLYYSGTTNSPAGATLIGTINNPNGNMTFNINQTLAGGTNYFWLVYDINANATIGNVVDAQNTSLIINSTSRTPSVTSPTGSRAIKDAMSGTFTVGGGGDYAKISDAFNELTALGIKGNVTFNLVSDISETTNAVLGSLTEYNGTGHKVTITTSAPRTITGSAASSGVIVLNDADNVTIDGTASRYITIKNNNSASFSIGILISQGTNGAKNNTIKGVNVIGHGLTTQNYYSIYLNGNNNDNTTIDNCLISPNHLTASNRGIYSNGSGSNLTITNNKIKFTTFGIQLAGTSTTNTNLNITGNSIGDDIATETINIGGVDVSSTVTTGTISRNTIYNFVNSNYTNTVTGISVTGANTGLVIERNNINRMKRTVASAVGGAQGINIAAGTDLILRNNMVADVNCYGDAVTVVTTQTQPWGIRIAGGTGLKMYHNSVNMTGTFVDQVNPHVSAALVVTTAISGMDMRNNIFRNDMGSSNTGTKAYAVYLNGLPGTIDYNNYTVEGSRGVLAYYTGDLTTLSDVQGKTAQDKNSKSTAVQFYATDNLHLSGTSSGNKDFLVSPITGVTTDFDGETRRTANVQMGADELRPMWSFTNLTQHPGVKCAFFNYTFAFTPTMTFGDGVSRTVTTTVPTYSWYKDGNIIVGQTATSYELVYARDTDKGTYQARATFLTETANTNTSFINIEEQVNIQNHPASVDACMSQNTVLLTVGATGTISNLQWQQYNTSSSTWVNIQGANSAAYTVTLADMPVYSTSLGLKQAQYRAMITTPGNCPPGQSPISYTNSATVTAANPVTLNTVKATPQSAAPCLGNPFSITSNATGSIYGYQWQKWNGTNYANLSIEEFPTSRSKTLVFPQAKLAHTGEYRVVITGPQSCGQASFASSVQRIDVLISATIVTNPEPRQEVCEGTGFAMGVTVDGVVRSYNWQKDGVDLDITTNITANKGYFWVDKSTFENSGVYRCRVTVEDCNGINDIYTNESVLYVNSITEITRQPEDAKVMFGETATFYFDAHVQGVTKPEDIVVQWYKNGVMLNDDKTRVAGSRSNLLSIKNVSQADLADTYHAVVSGLCGTATTNTVSIKENIVLDLVSSPMNTTVCEDSNLELEVAAKVSNTTYTINYQWFKDTYPMTDDAKVNGATSAKLTVMNMTETDQATYYCRVWVDGVGEFNSDRSLVSMDTKADVMNKSAANMDVETGKALNLFVTIGSTTPVTYQWQKDGADIAGATTNTYTVANASTADAGVYTVIVTNLCGTGPVAVSTVTVTQSSVSSVDIDKDAAFTMWNAPNPSDDYTKITVRLDNASDVRIVISDATGRELGEIHNAYHLAGQFDINFNAASLGLTSGVYNYTMTANGKQITRQLVVVK